MEKVLLDLITHFLKTITNSIFSSLLYKKQVWWTKFISAMTCGIFLFKVVPTNYIFIIKNWLCKFDFINTIYSRIRPILQKGDTKMVTLIINFIVIVILSYCIFSLILKFCPNIKKRYEILIDMSKLESLCETREQYLYQKQNLLEIMNNDTNVDFKFLEDKCGFIKIEFFYKNIYVNKVCFNVKPIEEKDVKSEISNYITTKFPIIKTIKDIEDMEKVLIRIYNLYNISFKKEKTRGKNEYIVTLIISKENNELYKEVYIVSK